MAKTDSGGDSWPGFLAYLNKTFDIVRDAFGYAPPGAVFLAIGLIHSQSSGKPLSWPFSLPAWAAFVLVVAACYVTGNVMAGIAYMPIGLFKWFFWMGERHLGWQPTYWGSDWFHRNPTEVTGEMLDLRARHADFFNALDRRETLTLFGGSTAAALLSGWVAFYCLQLSLGCIFLCAGVIATVQFLTGVSQLRRVQQAIREADAIARDRKAASPPPTAISAALVDLVNAAAQALEKK